MTENKSLLMKSAMTYGLSMGIYWIIKYIFFIFGFSIPVLSFIYWAFTLAVPFIAYYLTRRYKKDIGGQIGFFHAWQFGVLLYFFAAVIVALIHYIFYQYIAPPDLLSNSVSQIVDMLKSSGVESGTVIDTFSQLKISPIQMAIQGIFNNVFYGVILSIPVAALLCQNNSTGSITEHDIDKNN